MLGPPAVTDVMATDVETVDPDTTALEAARRLREADIDGEAVVLADAIPETA